ncbi:unnamed protein product [Protopolystoma xenopodis]|uniref:Uncharacterized protein n=1 Tax=Protopolystoma xenopodis TaxID=117903 RepID=A0A448WR98_9PLAT|nr:unnamed protein product [Protopolystoma xenopodis]
MRVTMFRTILQAHTVLRQNLRSFCRHVLYIGCRRARSSALPAYMDGCSQGSFPPRLGQMQSVCLIRNVNCPFCLQTGVNFDKSLHVSPTWYHTSEFPIGLPFKRA